jgi:hypothetical protein
MSYSVCIIVALAFPIMGFIGVDLIRKEGFILSIVYIVTVAFATSVLQGSSFGFAGLMPPKYTTGK